MRTILTCAISLDGYLDDATSERLILSNSEDFDRVDALRATCDAILVGANTIRKDNPRLLIRSPKRQLERKTRGLTQNPIKVTITSSGMIDPQANFFSGETTKIIYTDPAKISSLQQKVGKQAHVVPLSKRNSVRSLIKHLAATGVERLLIEGGSEIITQALQADVIDEMQISIAPFFVGQHTAPRFVRSGKFPWNKAKRMKLRSVEKLGDVAVLHYTLNNDLYWLEKTIQLAKHCPPVTDAFAVGAVIIDRKGKVLAEGFSRETDPKIHAE